MIREDKSPGTQKKKKSVKRKEEKGEKNGDAKRLCPVLSFPCNLVGLFSSSSSSSSPKSEKRGEITYTKLITRVFLCVGMLRS